ncbi:hypothetical protein ONS95_007745 [Cadophora gregata]|uniref:uncharacterized protein n=1 Tax=Cadophora gregata TaxID=51156 RepID=UPI0026DB15B2|nr:uncharacterized protein ONS95_007745 [Cadophora gregata]KAK0126126.1 hypothetical protein ONS95_007745 [Cadophora gregata]
MLPPASSCLRALQRQLSTSPDSIWISDEALSHAFQRFCAVSKTRKRYGSFVPGPLESRRRLGKRRMTLQSNATPTPSPGLASLWSFFVGEVDRTRWQWEAPTTRHITSEECSSVLPKWFVEWATASDSVLDPTKRTSAESFLKAKPKRSVPLRFEFLSLRKALKTCRPEEIRVLCDDFNRKLAQTLSLGLHTEKLAFFITNLVIKDIHAGSLNSEEANAQCLAMCQAMWNGISSCKVVQFSDLGMTIAGRFMAILSHIRMSEGLQALAMEILCSVSKAQLQVMHGSILRLVHSWLLSCEGEEALRKSESPLALAFQSVSEATSAVTSVKALTESLGRSPSFNQDLPQSREILKMARDAIISSAGILVEAECIISSHHRSLRTLTAALSHLPAGSLKTIIQQCSSRILKTCDDETIAHSLPGRWLSLIAQLPNLDETLLLETWRQFGSYIGQDTATDILLKYWIGRDLFERPALATIIFDARVSQFNRKDPSTLLYVINEEREKYWNKMRLLFTFLDKLGDHQTIYKTLCSLKRHQMKVPSDIIDEALESMTIGNENLLAQKTFKLYRFIRYNNTPLRLEKCPHFIFSMISNGARSSIIWKSLGIPLYESTMPSLLLARHTPPTESSLTAAVAGHLTKMATLFAHCKTRSHRVAFRNVMQCLFHLRRHNAPITPELTRAMVQAGISRKILSNGWIAKAKAQWLLESVEKVEGTDVAATVDEIVEVWNQHISERVSKRDKALKVF